LRSEADQKREKGNEMRKILFVLNDLFHHLERAVFCVSVDKFWYFPILSKGNSHRIPGAKAGVFDPRDSALAGIT
jgi:hypothetical protein